MGKCEGCSGCSIPTKLIKIVEKYKDIDGGIMGALHEVQDLYGYISDENQKYLAEALNVSLSDITGIITFYSRFSTKPKGKYNIQVCMGTACYVKGAEAVIEKFKSELLVKVDEVTKDGLFSIEPVRCVGACGLAPAIVINGEVYGKVEEKQVSEIIGKYMDLEVK